MSIGGIHLVSLLSMINISEQHRLCSLPHCAFLKVACGVSEAGSGICMHGVSVTNVSAKHLIATRSINNIINRNNTARTLTTNIFLNIDDKQRNKARVISQKEKAIMNHKMRFVLYFVMAMVCLSSVQLGLVGKKGHTGPPGIIGIPSMKHCPVDSKITTFLRQLRSFKTLGQKGAAGITRRSTRVIWPYNCLHAGINYQARVFEVFTYECCRKCEFPHYSGCMAKYSMAQARCSSEAIRCIAQCINKKGAPPKKSGNGGMAGRPGPGGQKCSTTTKKVGSSYCLQKSCINV